MRKTVHFANQFCLSKYLKPILILLILLFCKQGIKAQVGTLDPNFGNGGIVIINTSTSANRSIIQPDGKILILTNVNGMSIDRYNADGTPDLFFGDQGRAYIGMSSGVSYGYEMALQTDGKILAAGQYMAQNGHSDVGIIRCTPDGSIDNSFGINGLDLVEMDNYNYAHGISIQTDGKIVVSGNLSSTLSGDKGTFLYRLMSNGGLDLSFGNNGKVITSYSVSTKNEGLVIRPNGKLVKGNNYDRQSDFPAFQLESFNQDGSVDTDFGTNGIAKYIFGEGQGGIWYSDMNTLGLQVDGKIICTGSTGFNNMNMALCRFNEDGSTDNNFGDEGGVITTYENRNVDIQSLDFQTDGKIITCAFIDEGQTALITLVGRYDVNGNLDQSFGDHGITETAYGTPGPVGKTVHVLNDGKILVTGILQTGTQFKIFIARYNGDNVLAANFKEVQANQINEAITITWQTLNESGTKSFTVERSSNAVDYAGIITVPAKGGTNTNSYSYTDKNPLDGNNYYRIKENAANGTYSYSQILKVDFVINGNISLYPNPVINTVTVKGLNKSFATTIRITDMNGREIIKQDFSKSSSVTLNVRSLAQGGYFVLVEQNGKVTKQRIVKE